MPTQRIRARWVLPLDGPPIEGGVVEIEAGRIAAVRGGGSAERIATELTDAVLIPGLVNAHTHLEFSLLAEPLGTPGARLPAWIRQVIAQRGKAGDPSEALAAGLRESLAAGVTTLADIVTGGRAPTTGTRPRVVPFAESIGFSAARVESAFGQLMQDFDGLSAGPEPAGLSPHAPYTVHPDLLRRIIEAAQEHTAPVAMHLAESREELRLLEHGDGPFQELLHDRGMWDPSSIPLGSKAEDYLRLLSEAPRALVIHGNYLSESGSRFLTEHRARMSLVYCPRTHAYFGHEPYPLEEFLAAGVRVVLGTDSRASNPDLSLLGEIGQVLADHPGASPDVVLGMATRDAAEALGLGGEAGTLSIGKRADLVALPCSAGGELELGAVLTAAEKPRGVWLAGDRVA